MYTVRLWLVGKHVVDFLLALIELFFTSSDRWDAMSKYWSKLRCLKGGGSLWAQIAGERGVIHQRILVPGLSRGVVCVILRLPFWYNTVVWHTDTETHDHGYYPHKACSAWVKTIIIIRYFKSRCYYSIIPYKTGFIRNSTYLKRHLGHEGFGFLAAEKNWCILGISTHQHPYELETLYWN